MSHPTSEFIEEVSSFLYNFLWTYRLWIIYEKFRLHKILDYIYLALAIESDFVALIIPIIEGVGSLIYSKRCPFDSQNTNEDYWISVEIKILAHRRSAIQTTGDTNLDWLYFCEVLLRYFDKNFNLKNEQKLMMRKMFPLNSNAFTLVGHKIISNFQF